ncbi:MAG: hypothetical protein H0T08_06830 [Acidobacteria bacterium]|jgi:hypothetical protein|nr:hypothetical protein [Acidobacteriota bacterium]
MITRKLILFTAFLLGGAFLSGCGVFSSAVQNVTGLVGLGRTGTIINKAWIRSSYAVVAADLLEVKRGESLDILDEIDFEKVRWYRVRAHDEVSTEGWIEAQNVIIEELLEKSKKIAEEDKDIPQQAIGQLRAATNLRLSPEQRDDNIIVKLDNLSNDKPQSFEIISWKYVQKTQEVIDIDDVRRGEQKQVRRTTKNAELEAAKEANEPEKMDEKYDIWYKVRLARSVSPAPSGWLFGRQVELQLPNDIVFYQNNNKKFIAWQRLDNIESNDKPVLGDTGTVKVSKPGSWVILSRSNIVKAKDGVEPDFDGILVLAYDKYNEEYYTAFRSGEVWGLLPLLVEGTGDNKTFTVKLHKAENQLAEYRFVVYKDKNRLKVNAPPDIPKGENK